MTSIIVALITATPATITAIIALITNKKNNRLEEISNKIDNNEKDHLRFEILSFAGDLRNGVVKTRQEFETIFAFYDKYKEIITALKVHNGYVDSEFDFIKEKFKELN